MDASMDASTNAVERQEAERLYDAATADLIFWRKQVREAVFWCDFAYRTRPDYAGLVAVLERAETRYLAAREQVDALWWHGRERKQPATNPD